MAEFYRLLLAEKKTATALARARGYRCDATAQELADWFERRYDDSGGTDQAAYEAAADLRSHPDLADRLYAHPVDWAGFTTPAHKPGVKLMTRPSIRLFPNDR